MAETSTAVVGVYPSDATTGCAFYRMHWPAAAVATTGRPVVVLPRPPAIAVDQVGTVHGINVGNLTVTVFQRPASYQIAEIIPILREKGVKVILDMDDSLSTIHPRNAAYRAYDPRINHRSNWMHAARACELADLVTVTTQALAEEYGAHGRVRVIPNHVPASYLKIERKENQGVPVVGWAGWSATHIDDLTVTRGMINQVLVETGAKFAAFGDLNIFQDLGIRYRPPHEHWAFESIQAYPKRLVGFDIGLVPLQDSPFNRAKSGLKILEQASLGIVPVATPTPDNRRLIDMGLAISAASPREWYDRVKELVVDNEYRAEMSKRVREIASGLTIEGNTDLWWDAWSSVV